MDITMDMIIWALAGGILGLITYFFMGFNEGRGVITAILIGAVGGYLGGQMITPYFTSATAESGHFSSIALLSAAAGAVVFLAVGHMIYKRWGA